MRRLGAAAILFLAFGPNALGAEAVSCRSDGGMLADFAKPSFDETIPDVCGRHLERRARVDQELRAALRGRSKEAMGACAGTLKDIAAVARQYQADQSRVCSEIKRIMAEASTCASKPETEQAACLENAVKLYGDAKAKQAELVKSLEEAKKKIEAAKTANEEALKKYVEDQKKMQAAIELEKMSYDYVITPEDIKAVEQRLAQAKGVSDSRLLTMDANQDTSAANGGVTTIQQYQSSVGRLQEEQRSAIAAAEVFQDGAELERGGQRQIQQKLSTLEAQARSRLASLKPPPKAGAETPKGKESSVSGLQPEKGNQNATPDTKTAASSGPPASVNTPAASPTVSNATKALAAGAGALPALAAAFPQGGSSTDPGLPFVPGQMGAEGGRAAPASTTLASTQTEVAPETPKVEASAKKEGEFLFPKIDTSFIGSLSQSSRETATAGASSRAPAGQARAGVSASVMGATGGETTAEAAAVKAEASPELETFQSADLSGGAVGIAGGDVHAAVQELEEEFSLGTEEGTGLTAAELGAFAPLEGGLPTGRSRQGAGVEEMGSEPLFSRSRAAHFRALMRGDLVYGVREKL